MGPWESIFVEEIWRGGGVLTLDRHTKALTNSRGSAMIPVVVLVLGKSGRLS
jgi:hypothetical protein